MKKLLAILLATLSMTAMAKENITMAYSFGAGDSAANWYRTVAKEANQLQNKYNFIFDAKPGAGGTIAANYTLANPNDSLWVNSSAGFLRPLLFPEGAYNIDEFRTILPKCSNPFVVASSKYKNWKEVPRDAKLSIATTGLGTSTHLVALEIAKNYPNMTVVPFKSAAEAVQNLIGGNVDFFVSFQADTVAFRPGPGATDPSKQVYWLGQTGRTSIGGTPLLGDQGFSKDMFDLSTQQQVFATRKLPEDKFKEIRKILVEASKTPAAVEANAMDRCTPTNELPDSQLNSWFNNLAAQAKKLSQGVSVK